MIRITIKGVTQIKHHQPLLFISCNLREITAKDGRIVKGLYMTVNNPTSSKRFANGIYSEKGNVLRLIKLNPKTLSIAIIIT